MQSFTSLQMSSLCNHQHTSNVLAICILVAFSYCDASGLIVTMPNIGTFQYSSTTSAWSSQTIFQFQGVRYAESPIGDRRFKVAASTTVDF